MQLRLTCNRYNRYRSSLFIFDVWTFCAHSFGMHRPRLLGWQDANAYHVISRTTGREFLFGPAEREAFGRMLDKMARFCGVEVLTWCCLSNHFHLLIRLSDTKSEELRSRLRDDEAALGEHLRIIYTNTKAGEIASELTALRAAAHDRAADEIVNGYLARIGDLSVFVKELKQRFSIWYNAKHNRQGTLWSARYRSVLVENSPQVLRTVAGYIDLNPVRAGLVTDPKDYRWCGYGQALGGVRCAQKGIRSIVGVSGRGADSTAPVPNWRTIAEDYRVVLFGKSVALNDGAGVVTRKGPDLAAVAKVLAAGGKLASSELFRLRVRHLTAGTALGSSAFLQKLVEKRPAQVSTKRTIAARPIRQLEADDFCSLRDLKATGTTSTQ